MSELSRRLFTGVVLALLVLFLIFKYPVGFVFLILAMTAVGTYEFLKLIQISLASKIISVATLVLSTYIAMIAPIVIDNAAYVETLYTVILWIVVFWWINNFWMVAHYPKSKPIAVFTPIKTTLLLAPLFFLLLLEPSLILLLLMIVWGADSLAYFSGKAFGKHKLAPNVSGGKTIEGMIGGLIGVLLVTGIWMFYYNETNWLFFLLALITGMFSVVGDLYASIYKREACVKDSGKLLPGHGGVLDRIDGLLATTPVFITGIQFL